MPLNFPNLQLAGFDLLFNYHADAILYQEFAIASQELDSVISAMTIEIEELVRGGGGESPITQRLRRALAASGWAKQNFVIEKRVNNVPTQSQTHEIDHVKDFDHGTVALEIEWNNKDPFFDRDLENFNRLHSDGAISIGIIVTRGRSLQDGLYDLLRNWASEHNIGSFDDLEQFDIAPTRRQRTETNRLADRRQIPFGEAWARFFVSDKFGQATTHWSKLETRLNRGVGSPCPIVAIGIPSSKVDT